MKLRSIIASLGALSLCFTTTVACHDGSFAGATKSAKRSSAIDAKKSVSKYKPGSSGIQFDTFKAMPFAEQLKIETADYLELARLRASNEEMNILGYSFFNLQDHIVQLEDKLLNFAEQYPVMGDYLEAIGITQTSDIRPEDVEKGVAYLYEQLNQSETTEGFEEHQSADIRDVFDQAIRLNLVEKQVSPGLKQLMATYSLSLLTEQGLNLKDEETADRFEQMTIPRALIQKSEADKLHDDPCDNYSFYPGAPNPHGCLDPNAPDYDVTPHIGPPGA